MPASPNLTPDHDPRQSGLSGGSAPSHPALNEIVPSMLCRAVLFSTQTSKEAFQLVDKQIPEQAKALGISEQEVVSHGWHMQ
jgi:hypothetical protein